MKLLFKLIIGWLPINLVRYLQEFSYRAHLFLGRHLVMDVWNSPESRFKVPNQDFRTIKSFALDDIADIQITDLLTLEDTTVTWGHSEVTYNKYIGVMLKRNQKLTLGAPLIFRNSWLRLSFAPAFRSDKNPHYMLKLSLLGIENSILPLADFHHYSDPNIDAEWSTF